MGGSNDSQHCQENGSAHEQTNSVRISLASPVDIRQWSSGEVTKPIAFDARIGGELFQSRQLADGGLLCQRIFGPVTSYHCRCGKYRGGKRAREKEGSTCDRCGVVLADRRVRRERMGHIELAAPVVHPFFYRGRPSLLAELLDALVQLKLTPRLLENIIEGRQGFVIGGSNVVEGQQIHTGPEGIRILLCKITELNLEDLLVKQLKAATSLQRIQTLSTLMGLVSGLEHETQSVRPEWMVLNVIAVVPPVLRRTTVVESALQDDRTEVGDLNRLYGRVIRVNTALKKLLTDQAPAELVRRSKRNLQRAVNSLFENEALPRPATAIGGRPLVSLSGLIKGKKGRFRGSLLGKRVDYSGRAVIVVNPKLRLWHCGLPVKLAREIYRPLILARLRQLEITDAETLEQVKESLVLKHLFEVMARHPVLLNRAPTLHRLNVQAFFPVLAAGNAIELHPLVCKAFNADFDGDQMAVHLPLSNAAKVEAMTLLASYQNILSPAHGKVLFAPSQDIVMGLYYLTMDTCGVGDGCKQFSVTEELELARATENIDIHQRIAWRLPAGREVWSNEGPMGEGEQCRHRRIITTAGRALFNERLPTGMPFYNVPLSSQLLASILGNCVERLGQKHTLALLEEMARLGFSEATRSGLSLGTEDLVIPESKSAIVKRAYHSIQKLNHRQVEGKLDHAISKAKHTETWNAVTSQVAHALVEALSNELRPDGSVNPVRVILDSGARGGLAQLKQLSGMRGLMARATGEVVEHPITSNFREGLRMHEFFISTHGSRKSLIDVGFKTAEGGYLTRRLVHATSHVVVTIRDCGTKQGIIKCASTLVPLDGVICGRVSQQVVKRAGKVVLEQGELITSEKARELAATGRKQLRVRSSLTCQAPRGVCQFCYGADRSTARLVELGTAVGVIAAQSIGEPGTQLTMQTKHTGGIAGQDITGGLERVEELFEGRCPALREKVNSGGPKLAAKYLLQELAAPYLAQGVAIDEKHFEIVISQMLDKVVVERQGDTLLLPGKLIGRRELDKANVLLPKGSKKAIGNTQLLGISQAALRGESFLAAASFREPKQVLSHAALKGCTDILSGLTENVIVGGLIRAGTGFRPDETCKTVTKPNKANSNKVEKRATRTTWLAEKMVITLVDSSQQESASVFDQQLRLEGLIVGLADRPDQKKNWNQIIELSWDRVFRSIHCVGGIDEQLARRLTNKIFQGVMKSKIRFASLEAYWKFVWRRRGWVVKNYLARQLKRRQQERAHLRELIERDERQPERERAAEVARKLLIKIRAEAQLTDHQQAVFEMAWVERLADREIARVLHKSNGAIRRTKSYIKGKLKNTPTVKELHEG